MTMAYLSHYPTPTCQRHAGDDPSPLTRGEMEIITNVSCGIRHKLIHTKYCTLGVSLPLFFPLLASSSRQMYETNECIQKELIGFGSSLLHDPPGQTNTPPHTHTLPSLPPIGTHRQSDTHTPPHPPLFQSCLAEMSDAHPHHHPSTHTYLPHPVGAVCPSFLTRTHTLASAAAAAAQRIAALALGYSCFHGSHVFCTCRIRRSRLRGHSYRFSGWLLIEKVCSCTPTHSGHAHARIFRRTRARSVNIQHQIGSCVAWSVIMSMLSLK